MTEAARRSLDRPVEIPPVRGTKVHSGRVSFLFFAFGIPVDARSVGRRIGLSSRSSAARRLSISRPRRNGSRAARTKNRSDAGTRFLGSFTLPRFIQPYPPADQGSVNGLASPRRVLDALLLPFFISTTSDDSVTTEHARALRGTGVFHATRVVYRSRGNGETAIDSRSSNLSLKPWIRRNIAAISPFVSRVFASCVRELLQRRKQRRPRGRGRKILRATAARYSASEKTLPRESQNRSGANYKARAERRTRARPRDVGKHRRLANRPLREWLFDKFPSHGIISFASARGY